MHSVCIPLEPVTWQLAGPLDMSEAFCVAGGPAFPLFAVGQAIISSCR